MTAAKVMGIIARLADCDGQASDAVSAYTQVKMEDAPRLLRIPRSQCPDIWIRPPRHEWPKVMNDEDPVVLLERNLYGHPLADLLCERQFEQVLSELKLENVPNWEMPIGASTARSILIEIHGTTSKWVERSRIWRPSGRKLMKNVDLDAPTSFLDHVYLGCTQRECKLNEICVVWIKYFCWSNWKIPEWKKRHAKTVAWSNDMEGHTQKCVERCCELANKKTKQLYKVSRPCLDDHHFKKEELESVGELSPVCTQIVLTCLELARIGGPDILWSLSRFMGCGDRSVAFNKQHFTCSRKLFARHNQTQTKRKPRCWSNIWCGQLSHKHTFFSRWVSAAYLWGQRSRDQNDH